MKIGRMPVFGALTLLAAAGGLAWHGQPDLDEKWHLLAPKYQPLLDDRQVQIDPAELLKLMQDDYIDLWIIDVRDEPDWNIFHLKDAERIPIEALADYRKRLATLSQNAVVVVVSNDERLATRAWQRLMVLAQPNAYILEGGLNHWLNIYGRPEDELHGDVPIDPEHADGRLRHSFRLALGSRHPAAFPDPHYAPERTYTANVKLLNKIVKRGGCG